MNNIVIYTDLDGSLLDHYSYSHAAADALLEELGVLGIPVVPASSKTRAELLQLRHELDNQHPFIVENGAAVFIPAGYFSAKPPETENRDGYWVKYFSLPRSHWLQKIDAIATDFAGEFDNFASLDIESIAALTGLDPAAAQQAAAREFGEPVHWLGSPSSRQRFIAALQNNDARVLQGGRFLHVSGDCDKGRALQWLNAQYGIQAAGRRPLSLAIGDSQNDAAMLEAADHALIIRSPVHPPPTLSRSERTLLSKHYGPGGWSQGVRQILQSLEETKGTSYG